MAGPGLVPVLVPVLVLALVLVLAPALALVPVPVPVLALVLGLQLVLGLAFGLGLSWGPSRTLYSVFMCAHHIPPGRDPPNSRGLISGSARGAMAGGGGARGAVAGDQWPGVSGEVHMCGSGHKMCGSAILRGCAGPGTMCGSFS
jgi:hypothetical protein